MFEASTLSAVDAPQRAATAPKRSRTRRLTTVDGRSVVFRRVRELTEVFTSALTQAGVELSPVRKLKVQTAAETLALAEKARGAFLRGEGGADLDEVIRAERRADSAVRRLGLPYETPRPAPPASAAPASEQPIPAKPTLAEHFARKAAVEASSEPVGGHRGDEG